MKKIIFALVVTCLVAVGCKKEIETKEVSFKVSGMTCEIGCAKLIESKLAKKEGVVDAKVVFNDSVAKVKFDASKTNAKELMTYVDGLANNMYKTSDVKSCDKDSKKECCKSEEKQKKACVETCKKECCSKV